MSRPDRILGLHETNDTAQPRTILAGAAMQAVPTSEAIPQQRPNAAKLQAIDMAPGKLQQQKLSMRDLRDYDFAVRTNFCNTFVIGVVLPIGAPLCTVGTPEYESSSSSGIELHTGLRMMPLTPTQNAALQSQLEDMQPELDKLRSSLRAYKEAEVLLQSQKKPVNIAAFHVVPSVLRHLPDIQTVVKLQQALQQVYCVH